MKYQIAVFDFDGIVPDTMVAFDRWVKENYGIDFSDPLVDLKKLPQDIFRFFEIPELQDFPLIPGAREGLERLAADGWEINFCSIRNKKIHLATFEYLAKQGIMLDSWRFANASRAKLDYTKACGGVVLVEDEIRHLLLPQHPEILRVQFHSESRFIWKKNNLSMALAKEREHFPVDDIRYAIDWTQIREILEELRVDRKLTSIKHIDSAKLHV